MGKGVKTPSGEVIRLKANFEVSDRLGAFYKGGPVQLSSDGRFLFTTCENSVKVVSCDSGRVEQSLEEEEDHVTSFVASDDGEWLVVGWRSLLLKQYSLKTWKCTRSWKGHISPVMAMAFDKSSTLLATGSSDSMVNVWDIEKQYCTHNLRGSKGVVNLATFHPNPEQLQLFTCSADCNVRVWDLTTSKCLMVLKNHVSVVTDLGFTADGLTLLSCGRDQVVHMWDLKTGTSCRTIPVFESVEGLVVLPPSTVSEEEEEEETDREKGGDVIFVTAGSKGVVRVWSSAKSHPLRFLEPLCKRVKGEGGEEEGEEPDEATDVPAMYTGLCYNKATSTIAAITYDQNIVLFDSEQFHRVKQFVGHLDEVLDMRFVGKSEGSLAVTTNSEQVKVFDRHSLSCQLLSGHSGVVMALDSSADGQMLVTSSKDNTIRLWGLDSGDSGLFQCVAVGTGHTHVVGAVAMSRVRGNFVASGSQDCTVKLWSLKGVAKASRKSEVVRLKVKYTQLAHNKDINSLDVSPNDKLLVSASQDKTAKLWQVADGALVGTFRGHKRGVWSAKFSPVDQCVATASGDSTIKLWAIGDFSCIKTFEGHADSVLKVVFLTRGMQMASSGSDGLVKLWTIKTNECVATLDEHTEKVWSLATSADGEMLVSGGTDSLVCLWKDVTKRVEAEAASERELQLVKEQELSNLLHQKDFVKAVGVAISLEQPKRVRTILQELLEKGEADGNFAQIIHSLREDQLYSVLKFCCQWNQNARHSRIAQSVMQEVLKTTPSETLLQMDDLRPLLEGLLPYTERHFQRLLRLQQLSKFVDYTLQSMKLPALPTTPSPPSDQVDVETGPVLAAADSTSNLEVSMGDAEVFNDDLTVSTSHLATPTTSHMTHKDGPEKSGILKRTSKKCSRRKSWRWGTISLARILPLKRPKTNCRIKKTQMKRLIQYGMFL